MKTGHTFESFVVNQATPLALLTLASLIIYFFQTFLKKQLKYWGFSFSSNSIDVDENLPHFFEAIKLRDADFLVNENQYFHEKYKMLMIPKDIEERLDDTKMAKKPIQRIHWYNLLANQNYVQSFAYISCSVPDREDYIVDEDSDEENDCEQSDMVTIALNLAYIDDNYVNEITFGPGISNAVIDI